MTSPEPLGANASSPSRAVKLTCGRLLGQLDELLPFLYITLGGMSNEFVRRPRSDVAKGLFHIAEVSGRDRSIGLPHVGYILPFKLCRDEAARTALFDIPSIANPAHRAKLYDKRQEVQAKLDVAFGGTLRLVERQHLDGFLALRPDLALFERLHEAFHCVTEIIDDPSGQARISQSGPFPWRRYADALESFHSRTGEDFYRSWSTYRPFLVFGNTGVLEWFDTAYHAQSGMSTPTEEPSKWFVLRPDLPDARLNIRFEMDDADWAHLDLLLGDGSAHVWLSNVFDPFPKLLVWGQEVEEGDLPLEMVINEEGSEVTLTVLRTDDPQRVLFRAARKQTGRYLLEGIVQREELAQALRAELTRFFIDEFDPPEWDTGGEAQDEGHVSLKDRVLKHPWLSPQRILGSGSGA